MPIPDRGVTSEELNRWMVEQANFRSRLEQRLDGHHNLIRDELSEIKGMVRETNGKTIRHGENIALLKREIEILGVGTQEVRDLAMSIKEKGCSQYDAHVEILKETAVAQVDAWSTKKKVGAAGGFAALGALAWPAIQEVAGAAKSFFTWLSKQG